MDVMLGFDPMLSVVQNLMDIPQEFSTPSQAYLRDRKAMARTPADIKELPNAYFFEIDMPGISCSQIKVLVEDNNMLVISGERKREEEGGASKEGGPKYVRMERPMGRFLRTFILPENVNAEAICATCKDGVLTLTLEKVPPPEPKKAKTIQVEVA